MHINRFMSLEALRQVVLAFESVDDFELAHIRRVLVQRFDGLDTRDLPTADLNDAVEEGIAAAADESYDGLNYGGN